MDENGVANLGEKALRQSVKQGTWESLSSQGSGSQVNLLLHILEPAVGGI